MERVNIYKYYKDLPAWAKGATFIGAGIVVFIVGRKVYQYAFPNMEQKAAMQLTKNIDTEINKGIDKGLQLSYPPLQYTLYANEMYEVMKPSAAAMTDYSIVESNLKKMKNDLDVAMIVKAFGTRQRYFFGLDAGSPKDLFAMVRETLGTEWFHNRVSSINKDWKNKGISYEI